MLFLMVLINSNLGTRPRNSFRLKFICISYDTKFAISPAVLAESYTCLLHALAKADDLVKISISVCWGGGKSGLVQRFCGPV